MGANINKLIIEYVDKKGISDKEELIAIIQDEAKVPEMDELKRRYLANIVNRAVATVRDAEGRRWILARRSGKDTQYVNLEKCDDCKVLRAIRDRLTKEMLGRKQSIKKVDLRITAVQLDLFRVIDANTEKAAE